MIELTVTWILMSLAFTFGWFVAFLMNRQELWDLRANDLLARARVETLENEKARLFNTNQRLEKRWEDVVAAASFRLTQEELRSLDQKKLDGGAPISVRAAQNGQR